MAGHHGGRRGRERGLSNAAIAVFFVAVGVFFWIMSAIVSRADLAKAKGQTFSEMRQLWLLMHSREAATMMGGYPSAGPWPAALPGRDGAPWGAGGAGFAELGWSPRLMTVVAQFRVEGSASAFVVSASGDLDRDGSPETWYAQGGYGRTAFLVEGPVPYSPPPIAASDSAPVQ
jgi:hypothetical protein